MDQKTGPSNGRMLPTPTHLRTNYHPGGSPSLNAKHPL